MVTSNQKVLITGGSSGIGLALAQKFLENNNTVIITGRNLAKLEKVKAENPKVHFFQSDVTSDAEVRKLAKDIDQQFGGIDVLINNAGIMLLLDTGHEANDLTRQFAEIDINFNSPIRLVHYFLPQLKKSKEAVIVNVSSGLAYVPFAQAPVYSATKSALHFWTRSIRLHLKPHNIKVLELLPPVVDTPLAHGADIAEDDNLKPMPPEKLAQAFWKGYINSKEEITPGISTQLKIMSRLAPKFIFKQLNKKPIPKNTIVRTLFLACAVLFCSNLKAQDPYLGKATKVEKGISAEMPFESKFIQLGDEKVHYVESGEGDPILLLHGLPSNLYIWRNIIPDIDENKKVIALDFLGFGKSSFPSDKNVSVEVQYQMLKDFIEAKGLKNITFWVQDIGSIAGMLYTIREPQNVKGLALFEAPFMPADVMYDQLPFSFKAFMRLTRTQEGNEKWMVKRNFAGKKLSTNFFAGRKLPKEAYEFYSQPWDEEERRYAITNGPDPASLSFTKGRGESEFADLLTYISNGMKESTVPKLYFYAKKGLVNRKEAVEYAMENFKNATFHYLGKGKHLLTESHPKQMSTVFSQWFNQLNEQQD